MARKRASSRLKLTENVCEYNTANAATSSGVGIASRRAGVTVAGIPAKVRLSTHPGNLGALYAPIRCVEGVAR